jgi:hypothetical protein
MSHETDQLRIRVARRRDHDLRGRRRPAGAADGHATNNAGRAETHERPAARLPLVVYVLALGTFLMGTTEFMAAGLLPEISADLDVSVARAGLSITVFAVGMIVGAPLMTMLTLRLPKRLTLILAWASSRPATSSPQSHPASRCSSPPGS